MLTATQLEYFAGNTRLVDAVDFHLSPGECVALMGPNGAGKSTLLKLLSGDLKPRAGAVSLNGRPLSGWRQSERACLRAVLPQHLDLAFPFTAFEVAMLGRIPHHAGGPGPRDHAVVNEVMALLDATRFADRPYTRLSGGERARVQLARVFAQIWDERPEGPRYLLLDEPTAPLDIAHQLELMAHLRTLAGRNIGVLIIVHDLNLAAAHVDRIMLLRDGKVLHAGTVQSVLTTETLREVFDVHAQVLAAAGQGTPLIRFDSCAQRAA